MKNNIEIAYFLWPLLTMICLVIFFVGLHRILKRTSWSAKRKRNIFLLAIGIVVSWIVMLSTLALKGFFADFTHLPPRPVLVIVLPLIGVLWFIFSKTGTNLLKLSSSYGFIYMQSFRILVELLLWLAFLKHMLPVQMSFEGGNFDILSGILALPAGYLVSRKWKVPQVIFVFNIVGLVLLLNILVIAVLSFPTSIRYFMNEPSNVIIAQFPYILLPGVLVPLAYTLHLFSLRQSYLARKNNQIPAISIVS